MCEDEQLDKDWIIELDVRPNQMKPIDPPEFDQDENFTRILYSIQGHTGEIISVNFNTRGDQVITASFDRTVAIWDVRTGK